MSETMMLIKRLFLGALTSLLFGNCTRDEEPPPNFEGREISGINIRFKGESRMGEERLLNFLPIASGDRYSTELIDESIKAIYGSGLVNDVRVLADTTGKFLDLVFEVEFSDRISAPIPRRPSAGIVGQARRGRDGGLFAVGTLAWEVEVGAGVFDYISASVVSRFCADRASVERLGEERSYSIQIPA